MISPPSPSSPIKYVATINALSSAVDIRFLIDIINDRIISS